MHTGNIFLIIMKQNLRSIVAVAAMAVACLCSPSALAQQPTDSLSLQLSEARVAASRHPAGISSSVPARRIDSTAFRRMAITTTADALRRMNGVNVRDYGGAGGLKTVSVRGLGAAHTTVTYDGLAVSNARQGQTDIGRFRLDNLSSITLTVAGSDRLLTPVRNIASATVELQSVGTAPLRKGTHIAAAISQGAFGMVNPTFRLTQSAGSRTQVSIGGDFFYARNDYPFTLKNGTQTTQERRANSNMQVWSTEANLLHRFTHSQLTAKASYYSNHRRLPGQVVLYTENNNEHLEEEEAAAQTMWKYSRNAWQAFAAGKFQWQTSRYADIHPQYPGGASRQHYTQREWYATGGASWGTNGWNAAYAADYAFQNINSNMPGSHAARHSLLQALSLCYEAGPLKATARLTGSLYFNKTKDGITAARDAHRLTPEASVVWKALKDNHGTTLHTRIYYKESFRVPTFTEAYYYHLGSQDLRPELTRQLGTGLTLSAAPSSTWWPSLRLTADGYYNRIDDKITSIPYNLYVWRTINMGRVRGGGLELSADSRWRAHDKHHIFLTLAYTLQCATDRTDPASGSYGKQPAYMPRHAGSTAVAYENPWVNLSISCTASGQRYSTHEHLPDTRLPAYAELGFALYRSFTLGKLRLDLRADLINALNTQYEIVRRYPMPGRAYKLTLRANL